MWPWRTYHGSKVRNIVCTPNCRAPRTWWSGSGSGRTNTGVLGLFTVNTLMCFCHLLPTACTAGPVQSAWRQDFVFVFTTHVFFFRVYEAWDCPGYARVENERKDRMFFIKHKTYPKTNSYGWHRCVGWDLSRTTDIYFFVLLVPF